MKARELAEVSVPVDKNEEILGVCGRRMEFNGCCKERTEKVWVLYGMEWMLNGMK